MRNILVVLSLVITFGAISAQEFNWGEAPKFVKDHVDYYLVVRGYIDVGEDPLSVIEDGWVKYSKINCADESNYDYFGMYVGGTEVGPIYDKGTYTLVGENGDGEFFFYDNEGYPVWQDCVEI